MIPVKYGSSSPASTEAIASSSSARPSATRAGVDQREPLGVDRHRDQVAVAEPRPIPTASPARASAPSRSPVNRATLPRPSRGTRARRPAGVLRRVAARASGTRAPTEGSSRMKCSIASRAADASPPPRRRPPRRRPRTPRWRASSDSWSREIHQAASASPSRSPRRQHRRIGRARVDRTRRPRRARPGPPDPPRGPDRLRSPHRYPARVIPRSLIRPAPPGVFNRRVGALPQGPGRPRTAARAPRTPSASCVPDRRT